MALHAFTAPPITQGCFERSQPEVQNPAQAESAWGDDFAEPNRPQPNAAAGEGYVPSDLQLALLQRIQSDLQALRTMLPSFGGADADNAPLPQAWYAQPAEQVAPYAGCVTNAGEQNAAATPAFTSYVPGHNPLPQNIAYRNEIYTAAKRHHLDPLLLAAVAGQETGGPGSDSGANIAGADGTGHGVFQIDSGTWAPWLASHHNGQNVAENADKAACILADNLKAVGGNVKRALHLYNAGSERCATTRTVWPGVGSLSYEDSVMKHLARLQTERA